MSWNLHICFTQCSPIHRVQTHGASNRDTHLYPSHNIWSVYLKQTGYVRRSGRIPNGMWSGRTNLLDSEIFISYIGSHLPGMTPKNSLGLAKPPPHWCQTFTLLFAQRGNGLLCGLWMWRQTNKLWAMLSFNVQSIDLLMYCAAWRFWTMGQWNRCSTLSRDLVQPSSGLNFEELAQMMKN